MNTRRILGLLVFSCSLFVLGSCASGGKPATESVSEELNVLEHRGQQLFLSGMNLAWIDFGRDLTHFDEARFVTALDELSKAGANTVRWWIHVNGSHTPAWDGDMVSGMPEGSITVLERALDMAWERGLLIKICLWSFDMLQNQSQSDPERNRRFLQDPALIQSYIDSALIPMIEQLGDHPAVVAWEIFNEPEGMSEEFGWTPHRVSMQDIQRFVNLCAGAIHRTNPNAKVTNGSWSFRASSDVGNFTNFYSDERLIASGGDELGYLDFYSVHFYQSHFGDELSPFHNPASHWGLDKPIVIGEFPAVGIVDYGQGIRTSSRLSPVQAYEWAIEKGYAGALAWTWTAHEAEFGSIANVEAAMLQLHYTRKPYIVVETGPVNKMPRRTGSIAPAIFHLGSTENTREVDLANVFNDPEDGPELSYSIEILGGDKLAEFTFEGSRMMIQLRPERSGSLAAQIRASDSDGKYATAPLNLVVIDPDRGNIAILKKAAASSMESESYPVSALNDGLHDSRWSSEYADDQWVVLDLDGSFMIHELRLFWEAAHAAHYEIQFSPDGENWTRVVQEKEGSAGLCSYSIEPQAASFIRLELDKRATEWGFSLWEFEAHGERIR